jgi:hypothetical protein
MYEAMDNFIAVDTWHSAQPSDQERFFKALASIVRNKNFSADELGSYLRNKLGLDSNDHDSIHARASAVAGDDAWAIEEFLRYTE